MLKVITPLVICCLPLITKAQAKVHPRQAYALNSDTIFWNIPELNAQSFLLFHSIDSIQEFNVRLQDKPLTLLLGKEKERSYLEKKKSALSFPHHWLQKQYILSS